MVAPVHEHHALVPNADRSALLAVDGRLPVVRVEERGLQAALAALDREHGVRAPFLRVVRRSEEGGNVTSCSSWTRLLQIRRGDGCRSRPPSPHR
jgi:hypothetical protein